MFQGLRKTLARNDWFGAPPKLYYRKEATFGTALGGLCTILAITLISFFMVSELYGLIMQPTYNQNKQTQFIPQDTQVPYTIDTDHGILAVSFLDYHTADDKTAPLAKDLFRYIRPLYFTAFSTDDGKLWRNTTYLDFEDCAETFKRMRSNGEHVATSVDAALDAFGPWYCPVLDSYTL